jgi:hypothetical protein
MALSVAERALLNFWLHCAARMRHAEGGRPTHFLNARLKAASDS